MFWVLQARQACFKKLVGVRLPVIIGICHKCRSATSNHEPSEWTQNALRGLQAGLPVLLEIGVGSDAWWSQCVQCMLSQKPEISIQGRLTNLWDDAH